VNWKDLHVRLEYIKVIDLLFHVARRKFGALKFWGTQYLKTPYPRRFCFLDGYSFHAFDVMGGYSFHAFVALDIFSISISGIFGFLRFILKIVMCLLLFGILHLILNLFCAYLMSLHSTGYFQVEL
jgi:site-specific recombinase